MSATPHDRDGSASTEQHEAAIPLIEVVRRGLEQFVALTNSQAEQVTGVRPSEDGWSLLVDVVELERIPATASVMATYRADLDAEGNLLSYERLRRYTRSSTDSP